MATPDVISPDLKTVLRRLKLSRMFDTLPERLTLAGSGKGATAGRAREFTVWAPWTGAPLPRPR